MSLRRVSEEKAVVIDVEAQRQSVCLEDKARKLQMRQECLIAVKPGPDDNAAVIVKHVQKSWLPVLTVKPAMRRSIILPELADFLGLPTPNRFCFGFRFLGSQAAANGKAAHGGTVGFESEPASQF